MRWRDGVYVDTCLPFGLRSAPKIFTAVADGLEWVVRKKGVGLIEHYLDDFIVMGGPDSATCSQSLDTLTSTCTELGIPPARHKQEGPCRDTNVPGHRV